MDKVFYIDRIWVGKTRQSLFHAIELEPNQFYYPQSFKNGASYGIHLADTTLAIKGPTSNDKYEVVCSGIVIPFVTISRDILDPTTVDAVKFLERVCLHIKDESLLIDREYVFGWPWNKELFQIKQVEFEGIYETISEKKTHTIESSVDNYYLDLF
jgi:hypothetical protein